MKSIELNDLEIKVIDTSLNLGKGGVFAYVELIIENYFFGVRQSDKDFPKQGENILKILNKEIQGQLFDESGTYDHYSAPTMEKYRAFAKEQIWLWFNLNTLRFEEFMEDNDEYKEWYDFDRPFHEFSGIVMDQFLETLDYPTTFLDDKHIMEPTQEEIDEILMVSEFEKKNKK